MKKTDKKIKKSNMLETFAKKDLINAIAKQLPLMKKTEIQTVLDTACNEIIKEVRNGKKASLKTFGVFLPVVRKSRFGILFNGNKRVKIPERRQFVFKPSTLIKYLD